MLFVSKNTKNGIAHKFSVAGSTGDLSYNGLKFLGVYIVNHDYKDNDGFLTMEDNCLPVFQAPESKDTKGKVPVMEIGGKKFSVNAAAITLQDGETFYKERLANGDIREIDYGVTFVEPTKAIVVSAKLGKLLSKKLSKAKAMKEFAIAICELGFRVYSRNTYSDVKTSLGYDTVQCHELIADAQTMETLFLKPGEIINHRKKEFRNLQKTRKKVLKFYKKEDKDAAKASAPAKEKKSRKSTGAVPGGMFTRPDVEDAPIPEV